MRTLGLFGGMTYHATLTYYEQINAHIQQTLGNGHSARLILHSFDYAEMCRLYFAGDIDTCTQMFIDAARNMKAGGAEALVMCCNTWHLIADEIERESGLPLLHIIDFVGEEVRQRGLRRVAVLGTKAVMEERFMVGRLEERFGVEVVVPGKERRDKMQEVIFGDLGKNIITEDTKRFFLDVVGEMKGSGAEGIVLACTELQFVVKPDDTDIPLFDTAELHARGAAEWSISGKAP